MERGRREAMWGRGAYTTRVGRGRRVCGCVGTMEKEGRQTAPHTEEMLPSVASARPTTYWFLLRRSLRRNDTHQRRCSTRPTRHADRHDWTHCCSELTTSVSSSARSSSSSISACTVKRENTSVESRIHRRLHRQFLGNDKRGTQGGVSNDATPFDAALAVTVRTQGRKQ